MADGSELLERVRELEELETLAREACAGAGRLVVVEARAGLGKTRLLQAARGVLRYVETPRLTPLAFPLWVERLRGGVHADDWKSRVERMLVQLEKAANR